MCRTTQIVILSLVLFTINTASADDGITIHYLNDPGYTCTCAAENYMFYAYCDSWYDQLDSKTGYVKRGSYDAYDKLREKKFCDDGQEAWCEDDTAGGLDNYEVAMLCTHGTDDNDEFRARPCWGGSGSEDCEAHADIWALGNDDLNFLVLHSCHSLDYNLWADWGGYMDGAHQVDGWHGGTCLSCSAAGGDGLISEYASFVDDAFTQSMASAWTDNLNFINDGSDNDWCAVALVEGNTSRGATTRLINEQYDNVLSDPTGGYIAYRYISGCDPADESPL